MHFLIESYQKSYYMNSKNNINNYKRESIGGGGLECRANAVGTDLTVFQGHSLKRMNPGEGWISFRVLCEYCVLQSNLC